MTYNFNFKSYWNSRTDDAQKERAIEMVKGLMTLGHSEQDSRSMVESFQHDAFTDGEHDEAFNNCGEDA